MAGTTLTHKPLESLCERQMKALSPLYRLLATEQDRREALRKSYTLSGAELFALVEVCSCALELQQIYGDKDRSTGSKAAFREIFFEILKDSSLTLDEPSSKAN